MGLYEVVANDEDILKIIILIMSGMSACVDKLQKNLSTWDKYKHVWDYDKDAFMRRYAKANRPTASFDADIIRYRDLQGEVQNEGSIENIQFVQIDCSPLKQAIVQHCVGWQKKFTTLLNSIAAAELKALHELFSVNSQKLRAKVNSLDHLAKSLALLKQLQQDQPNIEGRFAPLQAQYRVLEKFEVSIKDEEQILLSSLQIEWEKFQLMLKEAELALAGSKKSMKADLERQVAAFEQVIAQMREEFLSRAPFSAESFTVETALDSINEFKQQVNANREQEMQMQRGLDIFEIEKPLYKEIVSTQKELDLLEQIWGLTKEWDGTYDAWKVGAFSDLKVAEMEEVANKFEKKLVRLKKDISHWNVHSATKERVQLFKKVMPLIMDLRSEALRERHWTQLKDEIGKQFDQNGSDFTLDVVMSLGLDVYGDFIGNLAAAAAKELLIEQQLQGIQSLWEAMSIDIVPYKDKGHFKIRTTEELAASLDDNQVTLSSMKASRYYIAFASEVEYWEKTLSLISEVVEMMLQVPKALLLHKSNKKISQLALGARWLQWACHAKAHGTTDQLLLSAPVNDNE